MKKYLYIVMMFCTIDTIIQARGGFGGGGHMGGGGFHGGGHMGGSSHMSSSRSGSRSGSRSNSHNRSSNRNGSRSNRNGNRNGNHNGNTYNHTNNFYGGYGYGGWGAWGAFGFTALATTGVLLAASANGNNNNAQLQQAYLDTQVEMEQLQQRLNDLEHKQDETADTSSTDQSPFNDPKAIKAYMEQLKKAQVDLKKAQNQQVEQPEHPDHDASMNRSEETEKKIETLQDRLNGLKAQLYDYWYGTDTTPAV